MSINVSELLVVGVVALLVIKPENLPHTAFTLGKWFKWFKRTSQQLKKEIEAPFKEIKEELTQESHDNNHV